MIIDNTVSAASQQLLNVCDLHNLPVPLLPETLLWVLTNQEHSNRFCISGNEDLKMRFKLCVSETRDNTTGYQSPKSEQHPDGEVFDVLFVSVAIKWVKF